MSTGQETFVAGRSVVQYNRDVRSLNYLKKNTAEVVREVSSSGRTFLITETGRAKAVIMGVEHYDRWKAALTMPRILAGSEAEFEAGKVLSQSAAFSRATRVIRWMEIDH